MLRNNVGQGRKRDSAYCAEWECHPCGGIRWGTGYSARATRWECI